MSGRGVVLSIHLLKAHGRPPVPVEETRALVGRGLEGDIHGKHKPDSSRQVLLVDRRILEAFGFADGALREQLTVDFPGLDALRAGTRLRIGEAVLEVTGACDPCETIGRLTGATDPYALREALEGKRGITSRVVAVEGAGRIRRGDAIIADAPQDVRSPATP